MSTTAKSTDVLPQEEANAIAALDEAKRQIDIARANEDVDSLLEWQDRAAAVLHYIRRRDEAKELADNAGEIKVRAEAALGKLDLAISPKRGRRAAAEDNETNGDAALAPLSDMQTGRRSAYRTLGKLEPAQLDEVVGRLRSEDAGGVTTARAVKEARTMIPVEERAPAEVSKDERKELISDYAGHMRALDTQVSLLVRLAKKVVARGTHSERSRLALRLSNDVARLAELQDFLSPEGEGEAPADED